MTARLHMRRGRLRAGSLAAIALLPFVMSSAASSDVPAPIDPRVALGPGYELVSQNSRGVPAHGDSWPVAISGDGRSVLFSSDAANLPGPDLGRRQLYVRDLDTGRTELVSRNDAGEPALADAEGFGISTDGRYVLFGTGADNFPSTDLGRQLFLRDRITRSTLMVGRGTGGAPLPDVWAASMSANGRRIAFKGGASRSTDQIYFRNLRTGRTRLLTRSDEDGAPVDDTEASAPGFPEISGNGRYVVFETASYEAFGNGGEPCQFCPYIHDLKTRTTTVITDGVTSSGPEWPEGVDISPNGRVVIWRSYSARVYDRDTDTHEPFSTSVHGTDDWVLSFSRTGRFIAFGAFAGPDAGEVYVHDRVAGVDVAVVREVAPVSCFSSTHAIDRSGSLVAFGCTLYADPQHEVVAEGHVYVRDVTIGS